MDKTLQTTVWNCLPREFREAVKNYYRHTDYGSREEYVLESIFGEHNLHTSDAEGEDEMLTVSRKKAIYNMLFGQHNLTSDIKPEEMLVCKRSEVLWRYEESVIALKNEDKMPAELRGFERGKSIILRILFGNKCLPDKN